MRGADPKNYGQAVRKPQKEQWKMAICEELRTLEENGVWIVVRLPQDVKILHTEWVYKTKRDDNNDFDRFKASLVACRNEQGFGQDYNITFAAVMDMSSVKYYYLWV